MQNDTNSLQHWGVLGMKWGRRKAEGTSGSSPYAKLAERRIASSERRIANQKTKAEVKTYNHNLHVQKTAEREKAWQRTLKRAETARLKDKEKHVGVYGSAYKKAVGLNLLGIGLWGAGYMAKNPKLKVALYIASIIPNAASLGYSMKTAQEQHRY